MSGNAHQQERGRHIGEGPGFDHGSGVAKRGDAGQVRRPDGRPPLGGIRSKGGFHDPDLLYLEALGHLAGHRSS
jgi:hypothetical protein